MQFQKLLSSGMVLLFVVSYQAIADGKINIAKDGKALMQIVVSSDAIPAEKNAAVELQKYLNKMTGAEFKVADKAAATGSSIYIGNGEYVNRVCKDVDFKSPGTDGIIIRTIDGNLILTGGRPRGAIYAVYTFLQDYFGCRWYAADEEKIPTTKNLSIEKIDLKYIPQFQFREYFCIGTDNPVFAARLRLNGREFMSVIPSEYGGCITMGSAHTLVNVFVKPAEHFKGHPNWYAWRVNEKKRVPNQLCMTNPQLQQEVLKEVRAFLEKEYSKMPEHHKRVSVSCPDNNVFCQCKNCVKVMLKENTPAGPLVELLNVVAKGIKEKYPDVNVNTLAYWHTDMPPRTLKCEDNIIVQVGTLDRNHKLSIGDTRFHNIIQGWKKVAKHIYIWDYDANFTNFIMPQPNHLIVDKSIKYYQTNGVEGIFLQGPWGPAAELYPMRAWVHAQMMWDARKDYRKLMDEFCNAYYGAGGKYILDYIDILNKAVNREKAYFLGAYNTDTDKWLTLDNLNDATELFNAALLAVKGDDKLTRRVKLAKLSIDIVWMQRYRELRNEAQKSGKAFLGPEDPYIEMDRLEKNEFGVDTYREWAPYTEYLQKLREKFPKRTSSLPKGFEKLKSWQWEEIQQSFFKCTDSNAKIEADPAASDKQVLIVRQPAESSNIVYTVPEELSGTYRVLIACRAVPAKDYGEVTLPVCVYYRPYPQAGITETARKYMSFDKDNCDKYKIADMGMVKLDVGTEIQIQPNGVGHFGKADAVYVDRILLICK